MRERNGRATRAGAAITALIAVAAAPPGCDAVLGLDGLYVNCEAAQTRCADDVPEVCNAGRWVAAAPCGAGRHCRGGVCLVDCRANDVRCLVNTPQSCVAGQWQGDQACGQGTCAFGACQGVCAPLDSRCHGDTPQSCNPMGQWEDGAPCAAGACADGYCLAPSCEGLPATCGPLGNESCCQSLVVPGGVYDRSNDPSFPATVSSFRLDRFEVTVGRFRAFLAGYPGNRPSSGAGINPNLPGSGWNSSWDYELPPDQQGFDGCVPALDSGMENWPVYCLNWYSAFAFCAWDGGRLPTEAEWNYAAAGGAEQRQYPWSAPPSSLTIDTTYAVGCSPPDPGLAPVGSRSPKGDGKFGQADLAGNVWEWVLDMWSADYQSQQCDDCANISWANELRVNRGGGGCDPSLEQEMLTSYRAPNQYSGVRCARSNKKPPPVLVPQKPFCSTDPPYGCAAICLGPNTPGFTDACAGPSAGPLTMEFEGIVEKLATLNSSLIHKICPPNDLQERITPCNMGVVPVEWPDQDHSACMSVPNDCAQ